MRHGRSDLIRDAGPRFDTGTEATTTCLRGEVLSALAVNERFYYFNHETNQPKRANIAQQRRY